MRGPVVRVQLERALMKELRCDAATFELEQESQAGAQQLVEVLDRERGEGVWVERRRRPAAQARDELLFEEALPGLVEDFHLARRADQVGELVEQPGAGAVERADPGAIQDLGSQVRLTHAHLLSNALPQLFGRAIVERDGEDLVRSDPLLDEPAETLGRRERLAGAWAGGDQKRAGGAGVRRRSLFDAELH